MSFVGNKHAILLHRGKQGCLNSALHFPSITEQNHGNLMDKQRPVSLSNPLRKPEGAGEAPELANGPSSEQSQGLWLCRHSGEEDGRMWT